jgi:phytoene synthase
MLIKQWFDSGFFGGRQQLISGTSGSSEADVNQCEELMRGGSKSFFSASRVLPKRVRYPAIALYAFCRLMDDIVDDGQDDEHIILQLQKRLDLIYAGTPMAVPADRALSEVVLQFSIPKTLLEALLEGFKWDKQGRQYESIEDLYDYAARVAGSVGAMMCLIMGVKNERALARACELGLAMQLTNIARDVGDDARNGRLYLPRVWLREEGVDPDAWLLKPSFTPAIARVVNRLLKNADELYARSQIGIGQLPRDCRAAIFAARLVYAQIGREIERHHLDSVSRRAVVSSMRKKNINDSFFRCFYLFEGG